MKGSFAPPKASSVCFMLNLAFMSKQSLCCHVTRGRCFHRPQPGSTKCRRVFPVDLFETCLNDLRPTEEMIYFYPSSFTIHFVRAEINQRLRRLSQDRVRSYENTGPAVRRNGPVSACCSSTVSYFNKVIGKPGCGGNTLSYWLCGRQNVEPRREIAPYLLQARLEPECCSTKQK